MKVGSYKMRSYLPGILVALLIGGVSSCGKPARQPTEKSSLEPALGAVDVPARDGTLKHGSVSVGGWAVAESTVQRVALYVDRQFVGYGTMGVNRPDIVKAFPNFPNTATSGWNAVIDLSPFPEGDHQMVMQIETKAGNVHDLPAVPFKVH
jgi:hypothetical protein